MHRPQRVIVSGYYGFSNIGDEAILLSLHKALCQEIPDSELLVLSANPEQTTKEHGVQSISRVDFLGLIKGLLKADLLISGGGSLFQDGTSSRSLYYYLLVIFMSWLFHVPVLIYAQGIGPIKSSFNLKLTGWVLKLVNQVTVRDEESLKAVQSMGYKGKVECTADPVMALPPEPRDEGEAILASLNWPDSSLMGPIIGISLRPWHGVERFLDQLEDLILRLLSEQDARIVLIPMHYPGDDALTNDLLKRFSRQQAIRILPQQVSASSMISIIGCLNLVIGVRLHALIFAAIAGTPAIAVSYDPKVDHFAQRVRQINIGNIARVDAQELWEQTIDLLKNEGVIRAQTLQICAELRQLAYIPAKRAAAILAKSEGGMSNG